MGVISFQNFLRGAQQDLQRPNTEQHDQTDHEEIAKLYEKMSQYTSRYFLFSFEVSDKI